MHDLLIRGATVIDGSGGAPRSLDVAVRDGRISAVESRRTETAVQEIDAVRHLSPRCLANGGRRRLRIPELRKRPIRIPLD
jgi:predicted amidohydrolase YtcJ